MKRLEDMLLSEVQAMAEKGLLGCSLCDDDAPWLIIGRGEVKAYCNRHHWLHKVDMLDLVEMAESIDD